jgi:peptide/nickel transport system substrate-binding protein
MNDRRTRRRYGLAALASLALVAMPSCRSRTGGSERLRILAPYLPEEIDPYGDSRLISRILAVNVFDPLVRAGGTGEPVPALASTWSNPAPDVWRFRLRPGARFSDGSPVTPVDVIRSFERARASGSVVAGSLASVREVRAEAPDTVTITASEGSSALLQTLTSILIAREVAEGPEGQRTLGSGPYVVTGFVPSSRVEMRASPSRTGKALPITEAVWESFGNGGNARERLEADPRTLVIDPPEEAVAFASLDRRLTVSSEFSGALAYLAFGLTPAEGGEPRPFADRRVREAVRSALDVSALLDGLGPAAGYPATQIIPSGVFGFDRGIPLRSRDLAAARALLAEAGELGRNATLDTTEMNAPTARAIAAQLGEAGLSIDVRVLPSEEFRERTEGHSDLFLFSWVVGPEAGGALSTFFHTKDTTRQLGLRNRTGYSSPEFDAAIEEAQRVGEPSARLPLLQKAIHVLDRELPWVALFTIRSVRIHPVDLKLRFRSDGMLLLSEIVPERNGSARSAGNGRK